MKTTTKKHSIYILTLAIIIIVVSGCSLINSSPSSKGEPEGVEEIATSSQEELNNGNEENGETVSEDDNNEVDNFNDWEMFANNKYEYAFQYPKFVKINDTRMIDNPETSEHISLDDLSAKEYGFLDIRVLKNTLGMSAIEFAQKSLSLAKENPKNIYQKEKISEFKGEKSFEYIADKGFEERGMAVDGMGRLFYDVKAFESTSLNSPFKIIYFDHNGYLWRIMYINNNKIAQEILKSIQFLD